MDGEAMASEDLRTMCGHLLKAGARYVCCWGPGCHGVHDMFDASTGDLNCADAVVMTTSHVEETWREVLWFATNAAFPDDVYEEAFGAVVVLAIGNEGWYQDACDYLAIGAPLSDEA